jgi:hypothetical protein
MTINPNSKIFDTMNILAERTGGRAFYNSNDIQGAIRRAIDDSRVTYVLGFYPDHGQWNGKFHEIKIKLKRPGTNVRYRRGYFAFADVAPADEQKRAALVRDALSVPLDSSSLGLTVATKAVDVPGAETLKITVTVDARDVVFNPQGDRLAGSVDIYFIQMGDKNKVIAGETRQLTETIPQREYQDVIKSGLSLPTDILISPGAKVLRLLARDAGSGSSGSVTIPLVKLFPSLATN